MLWQFPPYTLMPLTSALLTLVTFIYVWRRRTQPGVTPALSFLLAMIAIWTTGNAMEHASSELASKIFWLKFQHLGVASAVVAWFVVVAQHLGFGDRLTRDILLLLALEPALMLILVWTNDSHHLIWVDMFLDTGAPFPILATTHGIGFWVHVIFAYLLTFTATAFLVYALFYYPHLYRKQAAVLILVGFAPWITNFILIFRLNPWPYLDLTPISFTISAIAMTWCIARFSFLDVLPFALASVVEDMRDAVIVLNADDRIISLNQAAEKILHTPASSIIGQPIARLASFSEDIVEPFPALPEDVIHFAVGEGTKRLDYARKISPLRDLQGALIGRTVVVFDISNQSQMERSLREHIRITEDALKQAEESEHKFKELSEMLPIGVYELNENRNITYANQSLLDSLGYTEAQIKEKFDISRLVSNKDGERMTENVSHRLRGEDVGAVELLLRRKDGSQFPVISDAVPIIRDGEIKGIRGILVDISARKHEEEALKHAKTVAEEASLGKSRFLNTMSHELRTPLNGILGFTELLESQHFGPLNSKQLSYVSLLAQSGKHLLDLINDILDLAKLEAGASELNREEFSAKQLIAGAIVLMGDQFENKHLLVRDDIDPRIPLISGDIRRCKQILVNMLSNAEKYSPEKGSIIIRVIQRGDAMVKFSVSDQGPGIPLDNQYKIFEEFYQIDSGRDSRLGGTGIGLSLVQRLVKMHGGEVGVTSKIGEGATFWFTLPLAKALVADGPQSAAKTASGKALSDDEYKVLLVDDNEINLTVFSDMLSRCGHQVSTARNGRECIELAKSSRPDAILMDVSMPVMDGLEATRRLRKMPEFTSIPIIALTGNVNTESETQCLEAGYDLHLSKPVAMEELQNALLLCLSQNGHQTVETSEDKTL